MRLVCYLPAPHALWLRYVSSRKAQRIGPVTQGPWGALRARLGFVRSFFPRLKDDGSKAPVDGWGCACRNDADGYASTCAGIVTDLKKLLFMAVTYPRHGKHRLGNPPYLLWGDFVVERRHWQLHRQ